MENKNNMGIIWAVLILALIGFLIFISIRNKANMATDTNNMDMETNVGADGQVAKTGDMVSMNYTGRLENGTVFDSNVDPKFGHVQPFEFTLGAGQVIAGWDKGIVGMKVGEKKPLTIPSADGYGAAGRPPTIPPNATLIFDVELVAIK